MKQIKPICGLALVCLPGVGKDATAKRLAINVKLMPDVDGKPWRYCSVGNDMCRAEADRRGLKMEEFIQKRQDDPNFLPGYDNEIDRASLMYCAEGVETSNPFIITSRLVPALLYHRMVYQVDEPERIVKILFTCDDEEERIKRIVRREFSLKNDRLPDVDEVASLFEEVRTRTLKREKDDADRFKRIYDLEDIFCTDYFDEVFDTSGMSLEEQVEKTSWVVREFCLCHK
jgi:cytidylate kinase